MNLHETSLARLPAERLTLLEALRSREDVLVAILGNTAWMTWPAGDNEVLAALLPVPGLLLYRRLHKQWFRHDAGLPAEDVPEFQCKPLGDVLVPTPVHPLEPALNPRTRMTVRLAPASQPQATAAVLTELATLEPWAEEQPAVALQGIQAARLDQRVLLLGERLPLLARSERFWGNRFLRPLGFTYEPALAEHVLLQALAVRPDELLLVSDRAMIVPRTCLEPLTRGRLRLALHREAAWTR